MNSRIDRLLRPELRRLQAYYVQPVAPGTVKLDAMENPYELPAELFDEYQQCIASVSLNRYPNADPDHLHQSLKQKLALPADFKLILGNGSDELIQLLCLAVINAPMRKTGRPVVLAPEPSFAMYRLLAIAAGLEYVGVPLQPDSFALDMPAMLAAIKQHQPELIFIAYPNNPTGNLFQIEDLRQLAEHAPGLVVIDEAYHPFAEQSAIDELQSFEHVLLMRTLSKLGLAGIRLGILAGAKVWLQELNKLRLPYNINGLTQAVAQFACNNYAVFMEQAAYIRDQRQYLSAQLGGLTGIGPYPSRANFILFRIKSAAPTVVFEGLRRQNILTKDLSRNHPLLKDCLRVTVGTQSENERFLQKLVPILN